MVDARSALRVWLRHAASAYGADLAIAAAGRIRSQGAPAADAGTDPAGPGAPGALPAAAAASSAPTGPAAEPVPRAPSPRNPPRAELRRPGPSGSPPAVAPRAAGPTPDLPQDLDALRRLVTPCRRCKLCEHRTQTVFGEGSPTADVMFVGEAPGAREDELGRPFVGPAGTLLTRIIENAMGLGRDDVFIANVNKCRPPNNRNPEADEIAACLPFLRAQIRTIAPKVLVALGRVAAHNLLGTSLSMAQLRGRDLEYEGIPVVATWHPAYLLRQPEAKRDTWEDIKRVNRLLGRPEVPAPPRGRPGDARA